LFFTKLRGYYLDGTCMTHEGLAVRLTAYCVVFEDWIYSGQLYFPEFPETELWYLAYVRGENVFLVFISVFVPQLLFCVNKNVPLFQTRCTFKTSL